MGDSNFELNIAAHFTVCRSFSVYQQKSEGLAICYSSEFAAIIDALLHRCTEHKKWSRFKNTNIGTRDEKRTEGAMAFYNIDCNNNNHHHYYYHYLYKPLKMVCIELTTPV